MKDTTKNTLVGLGVLVPFSATVLFAGNMVSALIGPPTVAGEPVNTFVGRGLMGSLILVFSIAIVMAILSLSLVIGEAVTEAAKP